MVSEPSPGNWELVHDPSSGKWIIHNETESLAFVTSGLGMTPATQEANARTMAASKDLLAVCQAYEKWEGDMLLSQEAWSGGLADLPTITEKLWHRLLEIQAMRNAAIARAKGSWS